MSTPCQFKDFGKKVSDLLKKGFDFKNEVKVVHKSSQGVTIESKAVSCKGLNGSCKINSKNKDIGGEVEVNVSSAGCASATNAKITLNKLIPSGKVTISGDANPSATVEATYAKDFFAGLVKFGSNFAGKSSLTASGAVGYDDVAVGGTVAVDLAKGAVKDYNVGAEYSQSDLVASLVTSNNCDDITTSFFQKVGSNFSIGTRLVIEGESGNRTLTVGSDYGLDKSTTLKTSANSTGIVNTSVSHVLASPNVKVNVSAQFDALSSDVFKANKMGVAVSMGDF